MGEKKICNKFYVNEFEKADRIFFILSNLVNFIYFYFFLFNPLAK